MKTLKGRFPLPRQTIGIDWTNPITRGLHFAFDMGSPVPRELVRGVVNVTTGSNVTPRHGGRHFNRAQGAGTANEDFNLNDDGTSESFETVINNKGEFTLFSAFTYEPGSGNDEYTVISNNTGDGSGGSNNTASAFVPRPEARRVGTILGRYSRDTLRNTMDLWANGALASIPVAAQTGTPGGVQLRWEENGDRWEMSIAETGVGDTYIGGTPQKVNDRWRGTIYCAFMWGRYLSDAECAWLDQNWQELFIPAIERLPYITAKPPADKVAFAPAPQLPALLGPTDWRAPLRVIMINGNPGSDDQTAVALMRRRFGWLVTNVAASTAITNYQDYDLGIIMESLSASSVDASWNNPPIPILSMENGRLDEMEMTVGGQTGNNAATYTWSTIPRDERKAPLFFDSLNIGGIFDVNTDEAASTNAWIDDAFLLPHAMVIAHLESDPARTAAFAYEKGMADDQGDLFRERRVFLGLRELGVNNLTPYGERLLWACAMWAAHKEHLYEQGVPYIYREALAAEQKYLQGFVPKGLLQPAVHTFQTHEIDWSHPLAKNLIYYRTGDRDYVGGGRAQEMPGATSGDNNLVGVHGKIGRQSVQGFEAVNPPDGGIRTETNISTGARTGITAVSFCEITRVDSYGQIIGIPDALTGWASPYYSAAILRNGSGSSFRLVSQNASGTQITNNFSTSIIIEDEVHAYGAVWRPGFQGIYRDGVRLSSQTSGITGGIRLDQSKVFEFSRNEDASGEGSEGFGFLGVMWDRALSDAEMRAFAADPWQLLRPRVGGLPIYTTTATPFVPEEPGGADIIVLAQTAALTLTEYPATIAKATNINANVDALTLTEYSATIALDVEVTANTDALTLTEQAASISLGVDVATNTDALSLTEQAATIALDVDVAAGTDALTLTEYAASISSGFNITANTDALTLTEYSATIALDVDVAANTDALTLATYAASISAGFNIGANVDALTLTEYPAAITLDVDVTAATDALTLTELPASISSGFNIGANTDALTLTEYAATITVNVNVLANTDALTLTEYPASLSEDTSIAANTQALTLTTHSAAISAGYNIGASVAQLSLTTYSATLTKNMNIMASTAALVLTEHQAVAELSGTSFVTADSVSVQPALTGAVEFR